MTLGGLWHGAAWNYVLWQIYQGALLCIYRLFNIQISEKHSDPKRSSLKSLSHSVLLTLSFFILTCYGWLLFRATSLEQIIQFTQILFTDIGNLSLNLPKPTLPALLELPVLILYEILEYRANSPFSMPY